MRQRKGQSLIRVPIVYRVLDMSRMTLCVNADLMGRANSSAWKSDSLGSIRTCYEAAVFSRGAILPRKRRIEMKISELKAARRLITKVLANPDLEPGHRHQLRKASMELSRIAQSGKLDRHRVFRVVEIVSRVLLDHIESRNVIR